MKRAIHAATVEQVTDPDGDEAFRAVCLETGVVCDAWAFTSLSGMTCGNEGDAVERALSYLSGIGLHAVGSTHACYAVHRIAHDLAATPKGGRA